MPSRDDKVVRSRSILVEGGAGAMKLPAIDFDSEFEVRVREVDAAATWTQGQPVLLDGLGQAACDKGPDEPHLEIGVAGFVASKPATQDTVDLVRMATGRRVKASDAYAEIREAKRPFSQAVVSHPTEPCHGEPTREVNDGSGHRCNRDALTNRVLTVEKSQGPVRLHALKTTAIRS
jgi:hypothetical protein